MDSKRGNLGEYRAGKVGSALTFRNHFDIIERSGREVSSSRPDLTTNPTCCEVRPMATAKHTPWNVRYKIIPDYPDYRVGDDGSVWESTFDIINNVIVLWKLAKTFEVNGYLHVTMKNTSGKSKSVAVHRLVLEMFVGPCPEGMECCHAPDKTRSNNRLENLRWDTHLENMRDRKRYGRPRKWADWYADRKKK
jgi:hypothetical protein